MDKLYVQSCQKHKRTIKSAQLIQYKTNPVQDYVKEPMKKVNEAKSIEDAIISHVIMIHSIEGTNSLLNKKYQGKTGRN